MQPPSNHKEAVPATPRRGALQLLAWWGPFAAVAGAVVLFAVLKLYSVQVTLGDENLYFNMALLVNDGLVPHRDFFYTHPPLHLYTAALAFHLFGYSLTLGKLLPNLAALIGGVLVFAVGRRALRPADAALACVLFLLSWDPLRISSHFTGANLTFGLAMAGLWLAYRDRTILAGIAFGLGALVAVYVLPGAGAVALMLWGRSRSRMVRFVAATAGVVLAGNLLLCGLAGWDFIYQVYLTQFMKGPEGSLVGYRLYHRLGFILHENRLLTAGFVPGVGLLAWQTWTTPGIRRANGFFRRGASGRWWVSEDHRTEALFLFLAWFVLYWIFYLSISKHHTYYFMFIMPVFAWFSAHAYMEVIRALVGALRPVTAPPSAASRRRQRRAQGVVRGARRRDLTRAAVVVILTLVSISTVDALYVPYARARYGTRVQRFPWRPNPYFPQFDGPVRALFWDSQFDRRNPPIGITRYLQHETRHLTAGDQLYAAVQRHTEPGDPIFGDPSLAPLLASETGRRVAADLVDTSSYLLNFGFARIEDWIAAIEADNVRLLVVRPGRGFMRHAAYRKYAKRNFDTVARVRDPFFGEFQVRRRIEK